jgi:hypothetical protein
MSETLSQTYLKDIEKYVSGYSDPFTTSQAPQVPEDHLPGSTKKLKKNGVRPVYNKPEYASPVAFTVSTINSGISYDLGSQQMLDNSSVKNLMANYYTS